MDEHGVLRRIAWRELFPWLVLLRALRQAVSPVVLVLATFGVCVSSAGWYIGPHIFLTSQQRLEFFGAARPWTSQLPPARHARLADGLPPAIGKYLPSEPTGILDAFHHLSEPVARLLSYELTINEAAYYLFGFLWSLAVWGFVGGFITRRAIVQTALDDAPGLVETAQFTASRWPWYCLAPLYPCLGILILLVLHVPLGWLMRADFGVAIAGLVWLLVLLAGIAAAWLLIGTLLGWPLMWGALSAEREGDAFEAFSRSFSYVYGRPLNYLFYIVVAAILGALGYAAAQVFVHIVYEFGFWAVSWGASGQRVAAIREQMAVLGAGGPKPEQPLALALTLLSFWRGVTFTFLQGYAFAYFWSAAGIIYMLLRYDVDEKEMDEVYLPEDEPPARPPGAAPVASSTPAATGTEPSSPAATDSEE